MLLLINKELEENRMQHFRYFKSNFFLLLDCFLIVLSAFIAYFFLIPYVSLPLTSYAILTFTTLVAFSISASFLKVCSNLYRYTNLTDMIRIFITILFSYFIAALTGLFWIEGMSIRFTFLGCLLSMLVVCGEHICVRIYFEYRRKQKTKEPYSKNVSVLVVGAGEAGRLFLQQTFKHFSPYKIIGFVDDDKRKHYMNLFGVPILGVVEDIPHLVLSKSIQQITIAIPSLHPKEMERIVSICLQTNVPVNLIPSIEDVMDGKLSVQRFREIDVVDLLGREEITLDSGLLSESIVGKVVLVSGAGGSIGSEICRIVCQFSPKQLILLGHGENSIYQICQELQNHYRNEIDFLPKIADIQDKERIRNIMKEYIPDIVYHAAAHKHVPLMEANPYEAIKNNVLGTINMAEAAKEANVGVFIMVSTDKAVNPPNVMGATKRMAEMIVTGLNEKGKTKFAAVRFGNVLGSRGSVVPLFKKQIQAGGPVTVTDFRMTRYFMTIPEASRLVIQAGALLNGGEIFVLDMGDPVKILDLAKKMIALCGYSEKEISILETGIRPGEKLYEELLIDSEKTGEKVFNKIFVGQALKGSIEETLAFVNSIEKYSPEKVRSEILSFAKQSIYEVQRPHKAHLKELPPKTIPIYSSSSAS